MLKRKDAENGAGLKDRNVSNALENVSVWFGFEFAISNEGGFKHYA